MRGRTRSLVAVAGMTAVIGVGGLAGSVQAAPQKADGASCSLGQVCLWDLKNYKRQQTSWGATPTSANACSKGARGLIDLRRHTNRLPRSGWNKSTRNWYLVGKDKKTVKLTIPKRGMRGSKVPDIAKYKEVYYMCWK
ncbi:hypothetical protein ACFWOY_18380 [Streptomyces sp. NPDC058423]|uniref:hypothetical protein n=1 Tax=unclassified Streptomyces TaxID=2593676 RepID=UPI0036498559